MFFPRSSNGPFSDPARNHEANLAAGMGAIDGFAAPLRAFETGVSWVCNSSQVGRAACGLINSVVSPVMNAAANLVPDSVRQSVNQFPERVERTYGIPRDMTQTCLNNLGSLGSTAAFTAVGGVAQAAFSGIRGSRFVTSSITENYIRSSESSLLYNSVMETNGTMTVFIRLVAAGSAKIGESTSTTGTVFKAFSNIENHALKSGATKLNLQWDPANTRLFELAQRSPKFQFLGNHSPLGGVIKGPTGKFPLFNFKNYNGNASQSIFRYTMLSYGGLAAFGESIQQNGLTDGYNDCNPDATVSDGEASGGDIGGVGNKAGIIEDLFSHYEELKSKYHLFYIPALEGKLPFTEDEFMQLAQEVSSCINVHDVIGYFSLHFNQNYQQYPVLHPSMQNTLLGRVLSLLDFYMKGFLNGGYFDENFIKEWQATKTNDPKILKEKCIDLHDYCQTHLNSDYYSVSELLTILKEKDEQDGVEAEPAFFSNYTSFRSSFRIIAKQNDIKHYEELFLLKDGDFDVFYTIEPDEVYKEALEKFRLEFNRDPRGYQRLEQAYEMMKDQIHTLMPRLPHCQNLFEMLKIINFFSFYFKTLKKHQKVPLFSSRETNKEFASFPLFPHLPIRKIHRQDIPIKFDDLFGSLTLSAKKTVYQFLSTASLNSFFIPSEVMEIVEIELKKSVQRYSTVPLSNEQIKQINYKKLIEELLRSLTVSIKQILKELIEAHEEMLKAQTKIYEEAQITVSQKVARYQQGIQSLRNQENDIKQMSASYDFNSVQTALNQISQRVQQAQQEIGSMQAQLLKIKEQQATFQRNRDLYKNLPAIFASDVLFKSLIIDYIDPLLQTLKFICPLRIPVIQFINELSEEERQNHVKVVGGCRLDLTNLTRTFEPSGEFILEEILDTILAIPAEKMMAIKPTSNSQKFIKPSGFVIKLNFIDFSQSDNSDYEWVELSKTNEPPETALYKAETFRALENSDLATFKKAMKRPDCVNAVDCRGIHLIHYAASVENPAFIEELLKAQVSITTRDAFGFTALHYAAKEGRLETIKRLLQKNSSLLNQTSQNHLTPIHMAIQHRHLEVVKFLLTQPTLQINTPTHYGMTPLCCALHNGFEEIALLLLNHSNIDCNYALEDGKTPLYLAAETHQVKALQKLIEKKARVDQAKRNGYTPLHIAVKKGYQDICKILILAKANVNLPLNSGKIALHLAIETNNLSIIQLLLQSGANSGAFGWDKETVLFQAISLGYVEVAKLLIPYCAPQKEAVTQKRLIDFPNLAGNSPLNAALEGLQWSVVELLLANQVEILDSEKFLMRLCRSKADVALIRHVINQNKFSTAILEKVHLIACQSGHTKLMSAMTLPAFKESKGWTPLHFAVQFDHISQVRSFLKNSPLDLLCKDSDGKTLAYIAAENGSKRSLKLLLDAMRQKKISLDRHYQDNHLLKAAVMASQRDCVELLLHDLSDLNIPLDKNKNYAIHLAAINGDVEMIHLLKLRGADFNLRNANNQTIFHLAIEYKWKELTVYLFDKKHEWTLPKDLISSAISAHNNSGLTFLIENGYHGNFAFDPTKTAPLFLALENDDLKNFALLVKHGVSLKTTDSKGYTALHLAAKEGKSSFVAFILSCSTQGDPLTKEGQTALHLACQFSHEEVIQLLLKYRFDPLLKDKNHQTPLDLAKKVGIPSIIYLLEGKLEELKEKKSFLITALESGNEKAFFQALPFFPLNQTIVFEIDGILKPISILQLIYSFQHKHTHCKRILKRFVALKGVDPTLRFSSGKTLFHALASTGKKINYRLPNPLIQDKFGRSIFHYYAATPNSHLFIETLLSDQNVDVEDREGYTPLFYAIQNKSIATIESLLKKGANPNHLSKERKTPLQVAIQTDSPFIANLLLEAGAQVDQFYSDANQTALHLAALKGNVSLIKVLVAYGANVHAQDVKGIYPIHLAAYSAKLSAVRYLEAAGASLFSKDFNGETIVHYAAQKKQTEIFDYLKDKKVPLDTPSHSRQLTPRNSQIQVTGTTPLHIVAQKGNLKSLHWLVENKSNVHALTNQRVGVLYYAALSKQVEVVNLLSPTLISQNSDQKVQAICAAIHKDALNILKLFYSGDTPISMYVNEKGETALHVAALYDARKCACFLIELGADPQKLDLNQISPFEVAVKSHHLILARKFLKSEGVDIHKKLKEGKSYLHLACEAKDEETAAWLIARGLSVNEPDSRGDTPLHYAAKTLHFPLIKLLLICGAEIFKTNGEEKHAYESISAEAKDIKSFLLSYSQHHLDRKKKKETLLHLAVRLNDFSYFSVLLKKEKINAQNDEGKTALHLAVELGRLQLILKLIDAGADLDSQDNKGNTPLFYVSHVNSAKYIKILLNTGANPYIRNREGFTALTAVLNQPYSEKVKNLAATFMRLGFELNPSFLDSKQVKYTPESLSQLQQAIRSDNHQLIKNFLEVGGSSLIFVGSTHNEEMFLQILKENKLAILDIFSEFANRQQLTPFTFLGKSSLHRIYMDSLISQKNPYFELLFSYLEKDNRKNLIGGNHSIPSLVCLAIEHNNLKALKFLISKGKKLYWGQALPQDPLYLALKNKNGEIVKFLMDHLSRSSCNLPENLLTLKEAIEKDNTLLLISALRSGISFSAMPDKGKSFIDLARTHKRETFIHYFELMSNKN